MRTFLSCLIAILGAGLIRDTYALDDQAKEAITQTIGGYICQGDTSWVKCTDKASDGCAGLARTVLATCIDSHEKEIDGLAKPEDTGALSVALTWCVHKQVKAHYRSKDGACSTLPAHLNDR